MVWANPPPPRSEICGPCLESNPPQIDAPWRGCGSRLRLQTGESFPFLPFLESKKDVVPLNNVNHSLLRRMLIVQVPISEAYANIFFGGTSAEFPRGCRVSNWLTRAQSRFVATDRRAQRRQHLYPILKGPCAYSERTLRKLQSNSQGSSLHFYFIGFRSSASTSIVSAES